MGANERIPTQELGREVSDAGEEVAVMRLTGIPCGTRFLLWHLRGDFWDPARAAFNGGAQRSLRLLRVGISRTPPARLRLFLCRLVAGA